MYLALFLHLYQPSTQFPQILKKICRSSYLPMLEILDAAPQAKVSMNLTGALTEQLADLEMVGGIGREILGLVRKLALEGKVELVGTAVYHPLLPKLPENEIRRQIKLNQMINERVLGQEVFRPRGFFPPELFYDQKVSRVVESLGFDYLILDESAHPRAKAVGDQPREHAALRLGEAIYQLENRDLKVFFRDREASLKVAFADELTLSEFLASDELPVTSYQILALDGETFGHHRPGMLNFLRELVAQEISNLKSQISKIELVTLSDLLEMGYPVESIGPRESSWGMIREDLAGRRSFPRWNNPDNPVHQLQWELFDLALTTRETSSRCSKARELLDQGLQSDQFWWASHNPCWHPGMVERGAALLKEAVLLSSAAAVDKQRAENLYGQIMKTGRELWGEKVVEC